MAASPKYKVYNPGGEYVASCKYVEAAAAVVALYGSGATIRVGHSKRSIVWQEGTDGDAGESYDVVAEIVYQRESRGMAPWPS